MKIKSNSINGINITGLIIVMKEAALKPEYRTPQNRFYRATGGFGCQADAMGRAVFTICLFDGVEERFDRGEFEGWITDEEFETIKESPEMTWSILADGQV